MGKKGKAPNSKDKEMMPLYTDTTCTKDADITTWEGIYSLLEEEDPKVMEVTATAGSRRSSEPSIIDPTCSFLHKIAARPKILPYTDMVKWILDSVDITNRQFKTQGQGLIGSFTPKDLRLMYHLPEPQVTYNKYFMEKFAKENEDLAKCTKDWSRRGEPLKEDKHGTYNIGSLTSPYYFATAMLCILFGKPDIKIFSCEWLPLLNAAINATIVDCAKILSDNLAKAILSYRSKRTFSQRIYPPFYLFAYVMDAIYYISKFPLMG